MENVRQRIKMKLVSSEKCLQKLINKCTFKHCTTYNGNLAAVSLENKEIKFDKPIYIGNYYIHIHTHKYYILMLLISN